MPAKCYVALVMERQRGQRLKAERYTNQRASKAGTTVAQYISIVTGIMMPWNYIVASLSEDSVGREWMAKVSEFAGEYIATIVAIRSSDGSIFG